MDVELVKLLKVPGQNLGISLLPARLVRFCHETEKVFYVPVHVCIVEIKREFS